MREQVCRMICFCCMKPGEGREKQVPPLRCGMEIQGSCGWKYKETAEWKYKETVEWNKEEAVERNRKSCGMEIEMKLLF